jgi:hypothetical protein
MNARSLIIMALLAGLATAGVLLQALLLQVQAAVSCSGELVTGVKKTAYFNSWFGYSSIEHRQLGTTFG